MVKKIKILTEDFFKTLDIKPESIDVKESEEKTFQVDLKFSEADTGILIGYHGDTISALQLILNLLVYKQQGEWLKLIVNIGDYRQKRAETLEKMATDASQRVKSSGQPVALFNLNPYERRLIHEFLSTDSTVITESEGEAKNRHLIVKSSQPIEEPPLPENE